MQQLATTLTVIRGKLHPEKQAEATRSTARSSESICGICDDTGWRRAENEEFIGLKRCECVKEKIRAARLAIIPDRFRDSTFESYRPRNPKQQRALELTRMDPRGSLVSDRELRIRQDAPAVWPVPGTGAGRKIPVPCPNNPGPGGRIAARRVRR